MEIYKGTLVMRLPDSRRSAVVESPLPRMSVPVVIPGSPGFSEIVFVHRGDPLAGYWIPEAWLHDQALQAAKEIAASDAMATIRALQGRVDSMKEAAKRNQKTTEKQATKIRDSMAEILRVMPWATSPDRGLVSLVKEMVQNYSKFRTRAQDRDRYGTTLSGIRQMCAKALYGDGVTALDAPATIDQVRTTTELVEGVIEKLRDKQNARIADSERMGAEMTARRNFLARVWKLYKPGVAIAAGIDDLQCRALEDEFVGWLLQDVVKKAAEAAMPQPVEINHAEYERMQEEFLAIRAELKSTGHQSTGRTLADLVDIAIDTERSRHDETFKAIADALGLDELPFANNRDRLANICGFIAKYRAPSTLADVAERAVDREEGRVMNCEEFAEVANNVGRRGGDDEIWRNKPDQFTAGDRHWLQEIEVRMSTVESKLASFEGKRLVR